MVPAFHCFHCFTVHVNYGAGANEFVDKIIPHSRFVRPLVSPDETAARASLCVITDTFLEVDHKVLYLAEGPGANGAVVGVAAAVLGFVFLQRRR